MAKLYSAKFNSFAVAKLMGNAALSKKDHISLSPKKGTKTFATAQELADFLRLPAAAGGGGGGGGGGGSKFSPFVVDVYENELVLVEVDEKSCDLFSEAFVYLAQRMHAQRAIVVPFAMAEECAELLADEVFARTSDIIHIQMTGRSGSTLIAKAMAASFDRVRVISEPDCYLNICAIVHEGALGGPHGRNPSEWCQEKQSEVVPFVQLHSDRPGYALGRSYWELLNAWCRICNIFFLHFCACNNKSSHEKQIVVIKHGFSALISKNMILRPTAKQRPAADNLPKQHFLWSWRKIVPYYESYTRLTYFDSYWNYWLQTASRFDRLHALFWSFSAGFDSRAINWNPRVGCDVGVLNNDYMWSFLCLYLNATDAAYELQERNEKKFFAFCIEYEDLVRGGELAIRDIWQRLAIPLDNYHSKAVKTSLSKNSQAGTHAKSFRIAEEKKSDGKHNENDEPSAAAAILERTPWFGKFERDRLDRMLRECNKYGPVRSVDFEFPDSERY